jgi:anti-anti-sigma factor
MQLSQPKCNAVRIALRGYHLPGQLSSLAERLRGLAEAFEERHVLLDCRAVEFLDSSDLGTLIGLERKLRRSGGRLTLCNVHPRL